MTMELSLLIWYSLLMKIFDRKEPESHKDKPEEIHVDDVDEQKDDKKDDDDDNDDDDHDDHALIKTRVTGSLKIRTKKMQTPIPLPPRSPRIDISSDKAIDQELQYLMKSDLQAQVADPELWDVLKAKFEKSSTLAGSFRDDAFRKHDHDDHQGDDAPPEGEKHVKRKKTSKSLKFARGPQRNPNGPLRYVYKKDLFFLKYGNTKKKKYVLSLYKIRAISFPEEDLEENMNRWLKKEFKTFNEEAWLSIQHWKDTWNKKMYNINHRKVRDDPEEYFFDHKIVKVIKSDTESYQIKINLTAPTLTFPGIEECNPFSIVDKPTTGLIFLNNMNEKRFIDLEELSKFYDATLEKDAERRPSVPSSSSKGGNKISGMGDKLYKVMLQVRRPLCIQVGLSCYSGRMQKKSDFQWAAKAEAAFKEMKKLIAKLPTLTAPMEKEELIVYLAAAREAISAVLMTEREAKPMPDYFVSRALQASEINYTLMEKLVLAFVHARKRLKRFFQAHTIIVIMDQPIKQLLSNPKFTGRLHKWSIKLNDSLDSPIETEEELPDPWILFTDGSSCINGFEASLILTNPKGAEFTYALRFRFDATNNEALAEQVGVKNLQANVDSCLVANQHACRNMICGSKGYTDRILLANDACGCKKIDKGMSRLPDIAGPFLEGPGKVKFLIVEMDYFTKWIEAKPVATIKVIPAVIGMPTIRTAEVDMVQNDEALEINLDLLEERREQEAIHQT
nr:reverse transcriptase domain-containing protein [Tanacetum cinerariifolium]